MRDRPRGVETCGVPPDEDGVPGGYGQGQGGDEKSPATQEAATDNGGTEYGTQESETVQRDLETGASEESRGGGDGERKCMHMPEVDIAGVARSRPKHLMISKYGLLALEAPA